MSIRRIATVFALCLYGLLVSCSSTRLDWDPNDYTVRSGDTLYSIAWRYELDPMDLARWNRLSSPYLIRPGDRLHTRQPDSPRPPASVGSTPDDGRPVATRVITVEKGDTLYSLARQNGVSVTELAGINGLGKPYVIHPGQKLRLQSTTASTATPVRGGTGVSEPVDIRWQWPVRGELVGRFNRHKVDAKGIDIAGSEGRPVKAAAKGKVVYSGNGLISYGNLVIIKHSSNYLSAYAHNRKLLVSEGESVNAGQTIAELGSTGTDAPRLHFEIRRNGKPVDPLKYLPSS